MLQYFIDLYYRHWKKWGSFGNYASWAAAVKDCAGYNSAEIFEKVKQAVLKVKNGEAAYERDGALFYDNEVQETLLKSLEKAFDTEGSLRILDFGGSLGSTYFQHKNALKNYPNLIWCVVEQGHFVETGQQELSDDNLKFEYSIEDAIQKYKPNFILLASVLQYLENPYGVLKSLFDTQIPYVFIDKTPFIESKQDRIIKQIVSPKIYAASYPSWLFSKTKFQNFIWQYRDIETSFTNTDRNNLMNCRYEGYFLRLKK